MTTFSLNENDSKIAEFLVGSVDQSGYIRADLLDIVDDLAFTMGIYTDLDSLTRVLNKIHLLDPPGVGARDLQECLVLQLKRKKESSSVNNAIKILKKYFDLFIKKHYQKMRFGFRLWTPANNLPYISSPLKLCMCYLQPSP